MIQNCASLNYPCFRDFSDETDVHATRRQELYEVSSRFIGYLLYIADFTFLQPRSRSSQGAMIRSNTKKIERSCSSSFYISSKDHVSPQLSIFCCFFWPFTIPFVYFLPPHRTNSLIRFFNVVLDSLGFICLKYAQ